MNESRIRSSQHVLVIGNEKLCGDPGHIECHEPAVVLVRHIPEGVHMPEDVLEMWLCEQHRCERMQQDTSDRPERMYLTLADACALAHEIATDEREAFQVERIQAHQWPVYALQVRVMGQPQLWWLTSRRDWQELQKQFEEGR